MDLETRELRMLVAIADEGTVTRAATRLNVSQPALSHALRALERRVGIALFERQSRGLIATEAGERLLRTARTVMREIERARLDIAGGAIGRGELLRLSTECYTAYHWLPPVFQEFRERCPGVELRVVPSAIGHPLRELREETLDVAIVVRREAYAGFVYHELFEDEMVVIMHPDHPLASEPFAVAQHFADEHLLLYTEDPFDTTIMRAVLTPAGVMPHEISYVPATEALFELVRTGLGLSVVARWAVARRVRDGELAAIPLTKPGRFRTWSAAVRKPIANRSAIHALVGLLREHAPAFKAAPATRRHARRLSSR
ncbi:MAG TPA: LysR family transcriptional regulator [Gemmatimonadaceae bacterium]|nr:LysR family transcriptional regulator [Gemmatimonadaceae bacterium]